MTMAEPGAGVLHLLLSADERPARECREACQPQDAVVLMDAAVMMLVSPQQVSPGSFPCPVMVLESDLRARAGTVASVPDSVTLVNENELVAQMVSLPHCLSWR